MSLRDPVVPLQLTMLTCASCRMSVIGIPARVDPQPVIQKLLSPIEGLVVGKQAKFTQSLRSNGLSSFSSMMSCAKPGFWYSG